MALICSYCGSECGQRDQANGRCGSCACFFTGNEEVISEAEETRVAAADTARAASPFAIPDPKTNEDDKLPKPPEPESPQGQFDPTAVEPLPPLHEIASSEGLIQPRRLSPQFRRRVEMTWQSTFGGGGGGFTAESTLSSRTPSTETKSESPTLSIATRKISKANHDSQGASAGDYELKEVIGEGSMGRVWSARQTSLDRDVAVKVPMAELTGAGSVGESQFISEVVVTGKLEHPNIVPIYELGRDPTGVPFYSMKHVQGRPWNEFIDENTDQENLEILMKVCDAIAFAHDRNFLHRDIKPHNVMVGEFGEVSVMDWGIAVSITRDPDQPWASIATGPAGTPAYMAPEMAAHNPSELGVVSDIYLLGAVLYEIVTGTPPHPRTGDTGEALLAAAANEIIPTTRTGELVDIARRAMATKLDDRYQSVQELQDAIREYQSHRESIKLSESADEHFARATEQHSSDEFARARFAYEEALKLWDGNTAAVNGMRLATIAHAKNALEQENYELGISVLDAENPEHRDLLNKLETKRAARRRLAWFSKIAAATAVLAVFCVVGVTLYAYFQSQKSAEELRKNAVTLEENAVTLQHERDRAMNLQTRAETARDVAFESQREARRLEGEARLEKRRAEEAPYASEIGLAAESIRRNLFDKAEKILDKLDPTKPNADPVMSELRHIEWGLLKHMWSPSTVESLSRENRIEAVGSSLDGTTFAAGTEEGNLLLWHGVTDAQLSDLQSLREPTPVAFGIKLNSIAVSDDGRFLAAAGIRKYDDDADSSADAFDVQVWQIDDDGNVRPLRRLHGHTAEVLSVSFSAGAKKLVTSAADRTAIVWDRSSGRALNVMPDHLDPKVWNARFSPSGRRVVTVCEDGRVRVWDVSLETGDRSEAKKLYDFRGHDGPVYAAVFSPDGQSVISGGYDRRLLRWKLSAAQADVVSAGTELLKSRIQGKVDVNRLESVEEEEIGQPNDRHTASIQTISVGMVGDQHYILSGGNDNTVRVWNPNDENRKLAKVLSGHGRWVRSCVFSRGGQSVLSGAHDGLKIWSWRDYSMPRELIPETEVGVSRQPSERGLSNALRSIYSRDQRWIATVYANGTVEVWDMQTPDRATGTLLVEGHAMLAATGVFYDGGKQLLTSAGDNTTRLWDVTRGTHTQKLAGTGYRGVAGVTWRGDEDTALVVTGSDDRNTPAWLWRIDKGMDPVKTALLSDVAGDRLTTNRNPVAVRLAATGQSPLRRIQDKTPDVTAIVFSQSGDRFAIGDSAGNCFIYDVDAGGDQPRRLASFRAHRSAVSCAAFMDSSQSLITAGADGEIHRWDASSGENQATLPWSGPVTSLDVSVDGDQLLIGHAPLEGSDFPVAELVQIDGNDAHVLATLSLKDESRRDWTNNQPTVRSAKFTHGSDQALVSLFFPAQSSAAGRDRAKSQATTGYRVGYWNWNDDEHDFSLITSSKLGEVSSAVLGEDPSGSQLLVVGGKGARLLAADDDRQLTFSRLTKSFRPASKIAAADFSFDPISGQSSRLVIGDSEGNIRVWELQDERWSENTQAAIHLAGHHDGPIVSTFFDPTNPDRIISADRTGDWKTWVFKNTWEIEFESGPNPVTGELNFAMFSPDGHQVLAGSDDQAMVWRLDDQDGIRRVMQDWKPGKVQSAALAEDGSWIVTSDGDRMVTFWSAGGELLARMDEEDASGTTTMALTHDRRRLVSGQGKRIVIWDTSRILDSIRETTSRGTTSSNNDLGNTVSDGLIKELFTLRSDSDVTSVSISPDGRHLLSSEMNGQTMFWQGDPISPITVSFSDNQFSVDRDSAYRAIGNSAFVSDPSRIANFAGAELSVTIEGDSLGGEELALRPTTDTIGAAIIAQQEDGRTVLYHRDHENAIPKRIGSLELPYENTTSLKIEFNEGVDADNVQSLLRTLAYRIKTDQDGNRDVTLIDDSDGDAGTDVDVPTEEMSEITRTIEIAISGIHYKIDSDSIGPQGTQQQSPASTILRTIEIDVAPEEVDETLEG